MLPPPESPQLRLPTDEGFPLPERFPRQMLFSFRSNLKSEIEIHLEDAEPNPFPNGPISNYRGTERRQGFTYGQIGDPLTDQTFNPNDPYALHDALHFGLLTTSGWSAVMRRLMGLRRRSDPEMEDRADSARAAMAEERILNAYGQELAKDGPIPKAIGSTSVEAATQIRDFLPPGTDIPAKIWEDGLRLGGTLMFLLQTMGVRTTDMKVYIDLDAKDMYVSSSKDGYDADHKGVSVRTVSDILARQSDQIEQQYGTFMGTDGQNRDWYLPL